MTVAMGKAYEPTYKNRLTLIEDPQASVDYKIQLIRNAKHHIHIITFFWDATEIPKRLAAELNAANRRGVEVRILTTLIPTVGIDFLGKGRHLLEDKLYNDKATYSFLQFSPGLKFSVTHNLHEKVFLVDGEKAIIGGRNLSDSSLKGKDLEILMEGPVVNQVQDHFKVMFDFVSNRKMKMSCVQENKIEKSRCIKAYEKMNFLRSETYFPEQPEFQDGEEARIISHEALLHQMQDGMNRKKRLLQKDSVMDVVTNIKFKKLRAYNYFIMPTEIYKNFINTNLAAGNSIDMITNSLDSAQFSSNMGYIYSLPESYEFVSNGLKLYQWKRSQKLNYVHEKVLIFDEDHIIIGSHNFGTGSTSVSNEIAVEIKSKRIADRLIDVFESEKNDSLITQEATVETLSKEIETHKKQIKFFRKGGLGALLREIY